MNILWFIKFEDRKTFNTVVLNFTLPEDKIEMDAETYGRTMINPDYVNDFQVRTVERVCRTEDTVLCFEPC